MTLDILICTINEGIEKVPSILMPPIEGVRYVVSMQYTDERALDKVPMKAMTRKDVKLYIHESRGLCKNRNFALDWADADIYVIADDDNRYTIDSFIKIRKAYDEHPDADIICFKSESYDGKQMKKYPSKAMTYADAFKLGYHPYSIEITMRKKVGTRFDERFGLGSEQLCAGEEDVFLKDAENSGYNIMFVPETIVRTYPLTTGTKFLGNKTLQITKGATFEHIFGKKAALWRTVKEAGWWMVHKGANPFPIAMNMIKGIWLFK